jgi:hypothetical protein
MAEDNTLTKALVDVRARRATLQSDYDRIAAELTKLRAAEAALTSIVEGVPLEDTARLHASEGLRVFSSDRASPAQGGRRGARGPRANSAKGRLKALLSGAGPQGLSHAEIAERLPDVAPNTLNTYLSMMVTGGEAARNGDFFTAAAGWDEADAADTDSDPSDEPSAAEGAHGGTAAAE